MDRLIPLFNKGLGSPLGSGRQWFSWIHQQDLSRSLLFLIGQKKPRDLITVRPQIRSETGI